MLTGLNHRHAAIDVERLTRNVAGLVTREINDGCGDIGPGSQTACWNGAEDRCGASWAAAG